MQGRSTSSRRRALAGRGHGGAATLGAEAGPTGPTRAADLRIRPSRIGERNPSGGEIRSQRDIAAGTLGIFPDGLLDYW